jgi:hypothetical protein
MNRFGYTARVDARSDNNGEIETAAHLSEQLRARPPAFIGEVRYEKSRCGEQGQSFKKASTRKA